MARNERFEVIWGPLEPGKAAGNWNFPETGGSFYVTRPETENPNSQTETLR